MAAPHLLLDVIFADRPQALVENVVTRAAPPGLGRAVAIARACTRDACQVMLPTVRAAGGRGFYEALKFTAQDEHGTTPRCVPPRRGA